MLTKIFFRSGAHFIQGKNTATANLHCLGAEGVVMSGANGDQYPVAFVRDGMVFKLTDDGGPPYLAGYVRGGNAYELEEFICPDVEPRKMGIVFYAKDPFP